MGGEKNLSLLLKGLTPKLNWGSYVFVCVPSSTPFSRNDILFEFKEVEGVTLVLEKEKADAHGLSYHFVASWITLTVHSSLEGVGLTSAISKALADEHISCNVVAAFFHDHLFVPLADAERAMHTLEQLSLGQP